MWYWKPQWPKGACIFTVTMLSYSNLKWVCVSWVVPASLPRNSRCYIVYSTLNHPCSAITCEANVDANGRGAVGWYFEKRNIRTVNKYVILIWFTVWYHSTIRCWFLWHWHEHKNLRGRLFVHMAWNPAVSAIFYAPLSNSKKSDRDCRFQKKLSSNKAFDPHDVEFDSALTSRALQYRFFSLAGTCTDTRVRCPFSSPNGQAFSPTTPHTKIWYKPIVELEHPIVTR